MYIPGDSPYSIIEGSAFVTPMFFVTALVNGDQARDLLMHNREPEKGKEGTNRKAARDTVNKYAAKMLTGEWYLSPQPIILSEVDDQLKVSDLNDGQQRLKAVVQASQVQPDIRVPFTFAFDAPRASKWLLDQGRRRNPGDFLAMAGEVNAAQLSHAVRMLYAVTQLRPFQSVSIWRKVELTPQAYNEFLAAHKPLKQGLQVSREIAVGKKALILPHVGATLWWLIQDNFSVWTAQNFFTGLVSGANLQPEDPRLKVREYLSLKRAEKYKWDGFEQLAVLMAAANAWLIGQERFVPKHAFNKLMARSFPELLTKAEMPKSTVCPGNEEDGGVE